MKTVPSAYAVRKQLASWAYVSTASNLLEDGDVPHRYINELEDGNYGVFTWAMFQDGGQVGLIRLRVGDHIMYSGEGKKVAECL